MPRLCVQPLTVAAAAAALGIAPRTVRRLLQAGRIGGRKLGREWVVWWPSADLPPRPPGQAGDSGTSPAALRTRLRQVGAQLIAVGNQVAETVPRRGQVFLTWRTPRSLQVTLAIGRTHPTRGWAPHALGTELPFWLRERPRWRRVLPLLRRYERLRLWCHPRLIRLSGVAAVVQDELTRLETALGALNHEALALWHDTSCRPDRQSI